MIERKKELIVKIGIVIHSHTGNTYSVARKLAEKLAAAGHSAVIEQIKPVDSKQTDPKKIRLEKLPDLGGYEGLVLAAPVQAFSISPVMKTYLQQLPALNGKKVACFVTKGLPFKWTGGNRAISQIKSSAESRGGKVVETGIVVWRGGGREKEISDLVERLAKAF